MPVTYITKPMPAPHERHPLSGHYYSGRQPACVRGARSVLADPRLMAFLDRFEAMVTRKGA